jgi:O-antigen/teichoic acid export membrane protein
MPLFTKMDATGDDERTRRALLRSAAVMTAVGVPLFLVPCVIGDVFLARWVGEEYRHCSSYMIAMLLPMFLGVPLEPMWVALQARGRIGWIAAGDVVAAVLNPFLSLLLALKFGWGLLGFALGNTIAILLKNMLLRPIMNRGETAMPSLWRTMAVLPPAMLGGAPGLVLLWFTKPFYSHSLYSVIAAGAVGAVLSFAGATLATVGWEDTRRIGTSLLARVRGR